MPRDEQGLIYSPYQPPYGRQNQKPPRNISELVNAQTLENERKQRQAKANRIQRRWESLESSQEELGLFEMPEELVAILKKTNLWSTMKHATAKDLKNLFEFMSVIENRVLEGTLRGFIRDPIINKARKYLEESQIERVNKANV